MLDPRESPGLFKLLADFEEPGLRFGYDDIVDWFEEVKEIVDIFGRDVDGDLSGSPSLQL